MMSIFEDGMPLLIKFFLKASVKATTRTDLRYRNSSSLSSNRTGKLGRIAPTVVIDSRPEISQLKDERTSLESTDKISRHGTEELRGSCHNKIRFSYRQRGHDSGDHEEKIVQYPADETRVRGQVSFDPEDVNTVLLFFREPSILISGIQNTVGMIRVVGHDGDLDPRLLEPIAGHAHESLRQGH